MSDGKTNRPRRALDPGADVNDDTPTVELHRPRRGQDTLPESETGSPAEQPPAKQIPEIPATQSTEPAVWQPAEPDESPVPPPAGGRRFSTAALPEGHRATARRSAASALSPVEPPAEPDADVPTTTVPVVPAAPAVPAELTQQVPQQQKPERAASRRAVTRDRFSVLFAAVAAFASLALVVGMVFSALSPAPQPTPTASANQSVAPTLTIADLWSVDEAAAVATGTVWRITQTLTTLSATSPQVACLTAVTGSVKPEISAQRTLGSEGDAHYAGLHQLDKYSDEAAAKTVFSERVAKLAACDDSVAYIVGATSVTGLGDESAQATVAYQAATTEFHTVLLVRTGALISMFDVAHPGTAAPVAGVVNAARAALARSCARFGTCPSEIAVKDDVPAKTAPNGWLVVSDWPRLTPGSGRWTATDPVPLKSVGTACENLTLETVAGPTARQQRTFLLTQDPAAPQGFGADELLLTFPDATASAEFAKTLADNLASCSQRLQTATVTDASPVQGKVGTADLVGRSFTITQATAQDKKVIFQVAVLSINQHVVYVLINSNESFKLSADQLAAVALRAGQRTTQLS